MIVIGGRADATARYDLGACAAVEEGFFYDLTLCGWELVQLRSKDGVQVVEVACAAARPELDSPNDARLPDYMIDLAT